MAEEIPVLGGIATAGVHEIKACTDFTRVWILTKGALYPIFKYTSLHPMNKKSLILSISMILLVALFGGWLVFRSQGDAQNMSKEPIVSENPAQPGEIQASDTIDTSSWRTYRNEEYGFEVRYPEDAEVETFYSNGIGSPVDCKKTPEKCLNFSIKIQNKKGENLITMETFPKERPIENDTSEENSGSLTFHRRGKTVSGNNYTKSNSYFAMFSSCFTVVSFSDANLRKNYGFYFFKFYEIQGETSLDDAKTSCAKENKDVVFDEIIGSFRAF